jgi:hypothetical protein
MASNQTFSIYLYTTSACHLCELAVELVLATQLGNTILAVEISEDDALISKYGEKIPVLYRNDTNAELCWPFSASDIQTFLA